jgi:hypothetical protein
MKQFLRNNVPFIFNLLKKLKGIDYWFTLGLPTIEKLDFSSNVLTVEQGNQTVYELLNSSKPILITRFGSAELTVMLNRFYILNGKLKKWDLNRINLGIFNCSGVFPTNQNTLERFSDLYISCLPGIDALAVWYNYGEHIFHKKYFKEAPLFPLESLEPFRFRSPWSKALAGKKVLVVLPYEKSVKEQYSKKEFLFQNKDVLPDFEIFVYKPYNAYTDNPEIGKDWFFYLQKMIDEIELIDFEIALVAAGPFGLPLASAIKKIGKKAVHVGGALQLLFGIKGNRWEEREEFLGYINDNWIKPDVSEIPSLDIKSKIDNGSYW